MDKTQKSHNVVYVEAHRQVRHSCEKLQVIAIEHML